VKKRVEEEEKKDVEGKDGGDEIMCKKDNAPRRLGKRKH